MPTTITSYRVVNNFPLAIRGLRIYVHRIVRETARDIAWESRRAMEQSKSGRSYIRFGRVHVASASGEPPAIMMGFLHGDINVDQLAFHHYRVWTSQHYAPFLEFGTTKMAPRPMFKPIAMRKWQEYQDKFKELDRIILMV